MYCTGLIVLLGKWETRQVVVFVFVIIITVTVSKGYQIFCVALSWLLNIFCLFTRLLVNHDYNILKTNN